MYTKKLWYAIRIIILLNHLQYCTKDSSSTDHNPISRLIYVTTLYGGCNGQTSFENTFLKPFSESDTVFYTISDDTLRISIGHNYICCAPFEVLSNQENNNLNITLSDTCPAPYAACYCRCNCYYEFEVNYSNLQHTMDNTSMEGNFK